MSLYTFWLAGVACKFIFGVIGKLLYLFAEQILLFWSIFHFGLTYTVWNSLSNNSIDVHDNQRCGHSTLIADCWAHYSMVGLVGEFKIINCLYWYRPRVSWSIAVWLMWQNKISQRLKRAVKWLILVQNINSIFGIILRYIDAGRFQLAF